MYSLFSMSTSSLLLPIDFDIASFSLFSDKELKDLAISLSTWPKDVDAGPSQFFQDKDYVCR